jgi:hypothetical protein
MCTPKPEISAPDSAKLSATAPKARAVHSGGSAGASDAGGRAASGTIAACRPCRASQR